MDDTPEEEEEEGKESITKSMKKSKLGKGKNFKDKLKTKEEVVLATKVEADIGARMKLAMKKPTIN